MTLREQNENRIKSLIPSDEKGLFSSAREAIGIQQYELARNYLQKIQKIHYAETQYLLAIIGTLEGKSIDQIHRYIEEASTDAQFKTLQERYEKRIKSVIPSDEERLLTAAREAIGIQQYELARNYLQKIQKIHYAETQYLLAIIGTLEGKSIDQIHRYIEEASTDAQFKTLQERYEKRIKSVIPSDEERLLIAAREAIGIQQYGLARNFLQKIQKTHYAEAQYLLAIIGILEGESIAQIHRYIEKASTDARFKLLLYTGFSSEDMDGSTAAELYRKFSANKDTKLWADYCSCFCLMPKLSATVKKQLLEQLETDRINIADKFWNERRALIEKERDEKRERISNHLEKKRAKNFTERCM